MSDIFKDKDREERDGVIDSIKGLVLQVIGLLFQDLTKLVDKL